MLVVILRRQRSTFFCHYLSPASNAPVNARAWWNLSGLMDLVKYSVVDFGKPITIFIHSHVGPLSKCGAALDLSCRISMMGLLPTLQLRTRPAG
jgi:hypothetical protein